MHTIPELGTSVPAFLAKLWKLVEDPETDDLICWSPNGRSFFIRNQAQFARELLPHYYKHNNMASFVRQLNMYGFHKKVSVELGGLKCDRDEMEFAHQFFCKGHPYLVEHIKRKIASSKGQDPALTPIKPELMNKMLTEVRSMRGRQEHLDSRLGAMKRENEALWRELAMLRQKHLKQQQIVNKLIHFLVTLVQPSRSGALSVKRRYPLMIDDSNRQRSKQSKLSKSQASPTGPVIHELDASEPDLDSQYIVAEMLDNPNPAIESPEPSEATSMEDDNMETIQLIDNSVQLEDDVHLINLQDIEAKKKRGCKGKKKEETHLLEMPLEDSQVTLALLDNKSVVSKPVPLATVRSSKLAAMAANMNKNNDSVAEVDPDLDLEQSAEGDDDTQESDPTLVKLEDILIVPEIINEENEAEMENREYQEDGNAAASGSSGIIGVQGVPGVTEITGITPETSGTEGSNTRNNPQFNQLNNMAGNTAQDNDAAAIAAAEAANGNGAGNLPEGDKFNSNGGDTRAPKDLSLSCVNSSDMSDAAYRLGSMEEMDTHLETMQTELDNLRDILRGEGYSIDANTLLGLFGADDPMAFGMPVNPELNPHCEKEDDEHAPVADAASGNGGGELMAYNPPSSLLDFDDDIFLGATSSSPGAGATGDTSTNALYVSDPLDLEDNKSSLLDSLVGNNGNNAS